MQTQLTTGEEVNFNQENQGCLSEEQSNSLPGPKGEVGQEEQVCDDRKDHQQDDPPVMGQVLLHEGVDEGHVDGDDSSRDGPAHDARQALIDKRERHDPHR